MRNIAKVLDILIALYFFIIANIFFWGSFLGLFIAIFAKPELAKNPFPFFLNLILGPFLMLGAVLFFRKNHSKYVYGLCLLGFMLFQAQIYRFFFITNKTLQSADFTNLLFFGIPMLIIFLTKILSKKYKNS